MEARILMENSGRRAEGRAKVCSGFDRVDVTTVKTCFGYCVVITTSGPTFLHKEDHFQFGFLSEMGE